jgi:acetyltransferase-like isoleucine patch superfamily enzyme
MIDPSAMVEPGVILGSGVKVWRNSHIRANAFIGDNVVVGENVYIGSGVFIGSNTKIQNGAMVYEPAKIGEGVFIGPGACLTNDKFPRSVTTEGDLKKPNDWSPSAVIVQNGATIGAGAICVAPVEIGEWAMVGAGSVVIENVKAYGLYVGNPAKQIGWVNKEGFRLLKRGRHLYCKETGFTYKLRNNQITKVVFSNED